MTEEDEGRVKTVTLRVGARAKEGKGEGEGEGEGEGRKIRRFVFSFSPPPPSLLLSRPVSSSGLEFQHDAFMSETLAHPMKTPALQATADRLNGFNGSSL